MCSDNVEVAVVYQRSCYQPSDFSTEADWQTRLMIERSTAVLCPNIAYHLAGTKKVQQVLARPGVVEKFIDDADAVKRIRLVFAEQLSLDMVAAFFFLAHLLCFSRNFVLVCFSSNVCHGCTSNIDRLESSVFNTLPLRQLAEYCW